MNLQKAQQILWSMLTDDERTKHIMVHELARTNISDGITRTIVDYGRTEITAPAFLYFQQNGSYDHQANIVGQVLRKPDGDTLVIFQSADIRALLELYYVENILN